MAEDFKDKRRWIFISGWKGLCPRCGRGRMFRSWLRISERCEVCDLDYRFASPDDGPAFFSLTFAAFPLLFLVVWIQVRFEPSVPVLFAVAIPLMVIGTLLPLRPIKGWLVASQYVNGAIEAGTEKLWSEMHQKADSMNERNSQSSVVDPVEP